MENYTLKKSLGQHFLKEEWVCEKIFDFLCQKPFEQLLEVGPGAGALTKYLLKIPNVLFKAVELDEEKVTYLSHHFEVLKPNLILGDILNLDAPFEGEFTLIGNFPYNISTQIVFKVLDWKSQVPRMIGMFQKEVAERVVAKSGSKTYGILSVLVQAFYEARYLFDVPPTAFNPPPKVMSGVIELVIREKPADFKSEKAFFLLVKTAFNQRRKMLRNAVRSLFDQDFLQDPIFNKRAEQLSVEDFARLSFHMK